MVNSKTGHHTRSMIHVEVSKDKIQDFCRKWKVTELALFGSVLRGDFRPSSDIDVLVSFDPTRPVESHGHVVEMQDELERILGRKVDLVERSAIERSENYIRRRAHPGFSGAFLCGVMTLGFWTCFWRRGN
jgi:predicted nucleotidyltransferase